MLFEVVDLAFGWRIVRRAHDKSFGKLTTRHLTDLRRVFLLMHKKCDSPAVAFPLRQLVVQLSPHSLLKRKWQRELFETETRDSITPLVPQFRCVNGCGRFGFDICTEIETLQLNLASARRCRCRWPSRKSVLVCLLLFGGWRVERCSSAVCAIVCQ